MKASTNAAMPVPLSRLVQRLFAARAVICTERENGKLILECCETVGAAVLSISHIEAGLENGATIQKQDGQWHLFAADGNGIKCRDTLEELLTDLPPLNEQNPATGSK